jgi:CheY-like chemotaxis protein
VADAGCGMSPQIRQRLFEPFFTTKEVGKGTGLGLAMVFGVVQQHEGGIQVESREGQGSRFAIYLPTVADDADVGGREAPPFVRAGDETVLVAEDDPAVRNLAVRTLRGAGYKTLIAGDGAEAVRLYLRHRGELSLLLLDIVMPGMTGHEVYRRIRAIDPGVKVVFCTGYDPVTAELHLLARESLPLLEKPYAPENLLGKVRETLDEPATCELAAAGP